MVCCGVNLNVVTYCTSNSTLCSLQAAQAQMLIILQKLGTKLLSEEGVMAGEEAKRSKSRSRSGDLIFDQARKASMYR